MVHINRLSVADRDRLTLGTANLAMAYGVTNGSEILTEPQSMAILDRAWDAGIRLADTAVAYGESEARVGSWGAERDRAFGAISKAPPLRDVADRDISAVLSGYCTASLDKLRADKLKGYLLHSAEDIARPAVADALLDLKSRQLTEAIGVSIYEPDQGFRALETGLIDMLQTPYSIFDRRFATSGLADACVSSGVMVFARSVYLQGLLAGGPGKVPDKLAGFRPFVARIDEIAKEAGLDTAGIALRFVLDDPRVASVVIGANSPDHIDAAIEAFLAKPLENAIVDRINDVSLTVPPALLDPRTWPR